MLSDSERIAELNLWAKMFNLDLVCWIAAEGEYAPYRFKGTINGVTQHMQTIKLENLENLIHSFASGRPERTIGDDLRDAIAKRDGK